MLLANTPYSHQPMQLSTSFLMER
ncbi:UNVERIFIED_CONTAM: hypothetical protein GTU68_001726 [Idotea baltica]|nr:hypothetical protein [Idotea baltica]